MTRALGVIRLSEFDRRVQDQSTSPERQREAIEAKASQRGSEIVGWAEDLDVSASKVHPMRRPQLRQWFDRTDEYDEVIFWRLDRFVRRTFPDWADMVSWAAANQISLVSATEELDLSGPLQRLMATMFATVAEMESVNTARRVAESREYLRRMKRWGGGRPPYGYKIITNPDGPGKVLAVHEPTAEVAREAVRRVIAGESVNAVATDFNKRGITAPMAKIWGDTGLRAILRDKALLGHVVYNGASVLGDDGMPIVQAEPLVTHAEWDALQQALEKRSHTPVRSDTPSMLLNVAQCARCGGPLYLYTKHNIVTLASGERRRRGPFSYYRCKNSSAAASRPKTCDAKMISCKELNAWVDLWFTGEAFGYHEIIEQVTIPGANQDAQIAAVNEAIKDLAAQYTREAISDEDYDAKLASLRAERRRLQAMPAEPDQIIERPTGITVAEHWKTLDAADKRSYLLAARVVVHAARDERGRLEARLTGESPYRVIGVLRQLR
jgi:site-specific DNA recombinase